MADPVLNALDLITMGGLDRPGYVEDPTESILLNHEKAYEELYTRIERQSDPGTIGPDPAYDAEGNLIIDAGYAPDLSLLPLISKKSLAKIPASLKTARTEIPNLLRIAKEHGISTAWDAMGLGLIQRHPDRMNMLTKAYINTRKTIAKTGEVVKKVKEIPGKIGKIDKQAVGEALEKLTKKPYTPMGFKEWLLTNEPHKLTKQAIESGKRIAIEDIASPEGFKRYMYTVKPLTIWDKFGFEDVAASKLANDPSSPGYKALYKAFNTLIRTRIEAATASRMPRLESLTMSQTGGYAQASLDIPNIALREKVFKEGPKWGPAWTKSAGVHEATHIGQLQPVRAYNEVQHIAKQSGMKLDTVEGQQGVKWLDETFFGSAVDPNWKKYYGDKLQSYLLKGLEITDPVAHYGAAGGSKYYLQAKELSARMSEIRRLRAITNPTRAERNLLQNMENRELEFMTEEGLDFAVNKLWMAAPAMLDEEMYEGLK